MRGILLLFAKACWLRLSDAWFAVEARVNFSTNRLDGARASISCSLQRCRRLLE